MAFPFDTPRPRQTFTNYETDGMQIVEMVINIRTGPTLPASPQNRAVIEIMVISNPERLSLNQFFTKYSERLGWNIDIEGNASGTELNLPTYSEHLVKESAAIVYTPALDDAREFFVLLSLSRKYVYLLGKGYMTDSAMQDKVFRLFIKNFHCVRDKAGAFGRPRQVAF